MKTTLVAPAALATAALAPLAARAHEAGGAHLHPHPDPAMLVAAVAAVGVVALVAAIRGRR
jgi:hypothetical protein